MARGHQSHKKKDGKPSHFEKDLASQLYKELKRPWHVVQEGDSLEMQFVLGKLLFHMHLPRTSALD